MGFIVVHPGPLNFEKQEQADTVLCREVLKRGLNLDDVPRVRNPGAGPQWLYVWDNEADARALAEVSQRRTRDRGWRVQPVEETPGRGPLRPLTIYGNWDSGSWVFGLDPLTIRTLRAHFPSSCWRQGIAIGYSNREEFLNIPGEVRLIAEQMLLLLTGLSLEQLRPFESYRGIDASKEQEWLPPTPLPGFNAESPASATSRPEKVAG